MGREVDGAYGRAVWVIAREGNGEDVLPSCGERVDNGGEAGWGWGRAVLPLVHD